MRPSDIYLLIVVFASIGLSILFPSVFGILFPSVTYILMFFVFLSFLNVEIGEGIKTVRQNLIPFLWLLLTKILLFPLLMFGLCNVILPDYSIGILLLSGVSTGVVAPFIGSIVGANIPIILVTVVLTTLIIPFSLPALVDLLSSTQFAISFWEMVKVLSTIIFIPVLFVTVIRRLSPAASNYLISQRYWLSLIALSLINMGVFSRYASYFYQRPEVIIESILVALVLGGFNLFAGYLGSFSKDKKIKLASAVSFTNINNVLIIVFGGKFFGPLEPTLAAMYMFPFFLVLIPLRILSNRRIK